MSLHRSLRKGLFNKLAFKQRLKGRKGEKWQQCGQKKQGKPRP